MGHVGVWGRVGCVVMQGWGRVGCVIQGWGVGVGVGHAGVGGSCRNGVGCE